MTAKAWRVAAEVRTFFSACAAFDAPLIYCVIELLSKCVGNSAISKGIGFSGMCVVWLPETRGRSTCDGVEEEEPNYTITVH